MPSRFRPSSTSCTMPRPCHIATMFSERVSVHFTGPAERERGLGDEQVLDDHALLGAEAAADRGVARRASSAGSRPSSIAISSRTPCGPCDATQIVRPPAGSPGTATMPPGSIGTGATRWLTMRCAHDDVGVVEHALDRTGAHRVGDVRTLRLVQHGRAVGERGRDGRRPRAARRSRRSPSRPRRSPAPSSRRRPSRRCRRRSAPCRWASGGRFIVGGNMMKPCTSGRSRSAAVYTATTPGIASASLVSIAVDVRRARPSSGRTRCAAARRSARSS